MVSKKTIWRNRTVWSFNYPRGKLIFISRRMRSTGGVNSRRGNLEFPFQGMITPRYRGNTESIAGLVY